MNVLDALKKLNANIALQDRQIEKIHIAEAKYESDKDIESLIKFWEDLWKSEGLIFNGSKWTFRLTDLYIKQKRYKDAERAVKKIKNPIYKEKRVSYLEKIKIMRVKNKDK